MHEWVTFTATVTPAAHAGTVWFYDGNAQLGSSYVTEGAASISTNALAIGAHAIYAYFSGGGGYAQSRSPSYPQQVLSLVATLLDVMTPSAGDDFAVGAPCEIQWNSVSADSVPTVWVYVSRTLSPPVWEPIGIDVPNSGSYVWTVTGPGTNTGSQRIQSALVAVLDLSGRVGGGVADGPFSITDPGNAVAGGGPPRPDSTQAQPSLPRAFALERAWPNPSVGNVRVSFALPRQAPIRLSVIDLAGREIALLADGIETAGVHRASWDGRADGRRARAGLYFIRYRVPGKDMATRISVLGPAGE